MINFEELKISPPSAPLKASNWNGFLEAVSALPLTVSANKKNVGIGNIIPTAALHIADKPTNSNGGSIILGPTDKANLRLGYHSSYSWIQSHGSKPLLINPLGLTKNNPVGIGTNAPVAPLHINGLVRIGFNLGHLKIGNDFSTFISGSSSGNALFGTNLKVESKNVFRTVGTHKKKYGYAGVRAAWGKLYFYAKQENTTANNKIKPALRMMINESGNVGIGLDKPLTPLHVYGNLTVESRSSAERGYIIMRTYANTNAAKNMLKKLGPHHLIIAGAWDNKIYFYWKNKKGQQRRAVIPGGSF